MLGKSLLSCRSKAEPVDRAGTFPLQEGSINGESLRTE